MVKPISEHSAFPDQLKAPRPTKKLDLGLDKTSESMENSTWTFSKARRQPKNQNITTTYQYAQTST